MYSVPGFSTEGRPLLLLLLLGAVGGTTKEGEGVGNAEERAGAGGAVVVDAGPPATGRAAVAAAVKGARAPSDAISLCVFCLSPPNTHTFFFLVNQFTKPSSSPEKGGFFFAHL